MRKLYADGWNVADNLLVAFANCGYWMLPGTRILDLGCGGGDLVLRLRDLGFEAYGTDLHDRVAYRSDDDRAFFRFSDNPVTDTSDTTFDPGRYVLPFASDFFDVVVTTSVLEHVMDLTPMAAEMARVLTPQGFSFHLYPTKNVFVEPHIYVPLASRIQSPSYLRLWARLGVRNEFQEGFSVGETIESNIRFVQTGLKYRSDRELRDTFANYFHEVRFVSREYNYGARAIDVWRQRLKAVTSSTPLRDLSRTLKIGAVITAQKLRA